MEYEWIFVPHFEYTQVHCPFQFPNVKNKSSFADPSGCVVLEIGLQTFDCWDCGFRFHWGHRCLSLVFVVWYVSSCICDKLFTCSEESFWMYMCLCKIKKPQQWDTVGAFWAVVPQKKILILYTVKLFMLKLHKTNIPILSRRYAVKMILVSSEKLWFSYIYFSSFIGWHCRFNS
jgi:hypothetical protein